MNVRDVPWWGIASSAAPPVVLAAGWTIAASLQSRPYDPVAESVSAALAVWPAAASRHGPAVPWALRPEVSVRVVVVLLVLLAWFGLDLITSAGLAGLAERVLGVAQSAWPFTVALSCRHPVTVMAARGRPLDRI